MRTFVDFMEKYKVVCANVIIENPTIFLGDFYAALDKKWQYKNQIVAVLTVARDLNIDPAPGIAHKVVDALDEPSYDLAQHFDGCYEFLQFWLKKGAVLVHCAAGVSRSASVVIYYIMRNLRWSFAKSLAHVKAKRSVICPNEGFMRQMRLQEKLLGLVVFRESTIEEEQKKANQSKAKTGVIRGRSEQYEHSSKIDSDLDDCINKFKNDQREQEIRDNVKIEGRKGAKKASCTRGLITPSIGHPEISDTQSEVEITIQSTPSSVLDQQREKLQIMKQNLFKKKQEKEFSYIDRLAEPKTIVQEEREHIRLEREKQMISELPFQPQIGEQSKMLAQLKYTKYEGLLIHERLQKLEQERQNHVVELRLMINQQEDEEQEQKPPRPYSDKPPLYERYQQVMEEKKTLMLELKAKQKESESTLYKPKINQQSQLLAEIRYEGQNVVDRLVQDGIRKQNTIYPDDLPFDFQPQTNAVINDQLVKGDFTQRQEEFTRKQLEKNMELESRAYMAYTFKPQVNKASEKMQADRKISQDSLFDRLYSEYQSRQSHMQEKKEEEISKLNFNPELNSKSMQMAVDRKLEDLIKNEYGEYRKQLLKEKYDDQDKECSFYPSVSTSMKYSQMHSQYSFDDCHDKIKQQQSEKEQRRSQLKKQQESDELKECTFKPQTNKTMVDPRKKIEVYGLETFMLKVDMAKKQKDEQEQVAQRLFNRHEQYDQTKHKEKTDTKPFNLSSNRSAKNTYKK